MKINLSISTIFLLIGSFLVTSCTTNLQQTKLRPGGHGVQTSQFYMDNGSLKHDFITDSIRDYSADERKGMLESFWLEFVEQPDFEARRIEYRIKVDRLKNLLEKYADAEYFNTVASDLLTVNYSSLLAHFTLMQYHERRDNIDKAGLHENILTILFELILSTGQGTYYSPYTVSTLAEIEEFLIVGDYNVKGQTSYWVGNGKPMVEVLVADDDQKLLRKMFFQPRSVDKLEQELTAKIHLEQDFRRYTIFAELALMDTAAQTGMANLLVSSSSLFYKPEYIEYLLERSAKSNTIYHDVVRARYLARQAGTTEDDAQRKALLNETIDLLMTVAEQHYGDAYLNLYYLLREMDEYKNNVELMTDLVLKSSDFGSAEGSVLLADLYVTGNKYLPRDMAKAKRLYLSAFEQGASFAAIGYARVVALDNDLGDATVRNVDELLDKAIMMNDRRAILFKARRLFENKEWSPEDIAKGKELLKKLETFNNTKFELNEMAWIYATHQSRDIHDLDKAISLIAEVHRRFDGNEFSPALLDTAAFILAAAGDSCNAIAYQRVAVRTQINNMPNADTAAMEQLLSKYEEQYAKKINVNSVNDLDCGASSFAVHNEQRTKRTLGYGNGVYVGAVRDGKAHGNGSYYWDEGDRLIGNFNQGSPSGQGTHYWGQNSEYPDHVFQGMYVDGLRQGMGLYIWGNGDLYLGEYQVGRQTGQGKSIYTNGARYKGLFENGVQEGQGTYVWQNGNVYFGKSHNDIFQGIGEFFYAIGSHYKGEFSNNELNGTGVYAWLSGDTYAGEFKDGQKHGRGICVFSGESRPCQFEKGKLVEEVQDNAK